MIRADRDFERRLKKLRTDGEYSYVDLVNLIIDSRHRESVSLEYLLYGGFAESESGVDKVRISLAFPTSVRELFTAEELYLLTGKQIEQDLEKIRINRVR